MNFKWNVGTKIGTLIAICIVALIGLGLAAFLSISGLLTSVGWKTHTIEVKDEIDLYTTTMLNAETGQRGYIITGDAKYLEPYNLALKNIKKNIDKLKELTADNPKQQERWKSVESFTNSKLAELEETIILRKSKSFEEAMQVVRSDKGKTIQDNIRKMISEAKAEEDSLLLKRDEEMKQNTSLSYGIVGLGIVFTIAFLIIAGIWLVRNIAIPLSSVAATALKISEGDISMKVKTSDRADEVGQLEKAFSRQIDSLKQSLSEISESVSRLTSSTSEIMAATTQVTSSAAENAASLSETTTTVEEVRQASELSAQKAKTVADNSKTLVSVSQNGRQAVEQNTVSMNKIKEQMGSIAKTIMSLSEQSQSIGGIIASITDIADQCNLLAVNAGIEAAKAGENGKGFAVVAQELRSLAEQAKQGTIEVRKILNDVQKATNAAVLVTEQGNNTVESGVKQAVLAGEAINLLTKSTEQAVQAAMQIASSSQQQLVGMQQIGRAMEDVNQATTENAASMKQTETSVKEINSLSLNLKELVKKYKLQ